MRRPVLLRRRVWIPSLAAMIALVLFLRGAAPFVALEVALDHGHCFGKPRLPAQVFTSDPVELASWYEAHGEEIPLVPSGTAGLELVGGRFCRLIDRRVAHVYYSGKDQQLSVYVIPGSVRFDRSFLWSRNGTTVNLIHTGGANVAVVSPDAASVAGFRRSFERTVADAAAAAPR